MLDVALVVARTITVLFMVSVVVYRRRTFGVPWESGITIQLALQCAGLWLCGPLASFLLGPPLHRLTGRYHFEDLLGAILYVIATAVIAANMFQRVARDDAEAQRLVGRVLWPVITLVPTFLAACYWCSDLVREYDGLLLLDVEPDLPLCVLWCTVYATCGAHMLLAAWSLQIIADDPEQRHIAREWQVALYCGVFACIAGTINSFMPTGTRWDDLSWIGQIGIGAVTAYICARSWYRQMRTAKMLLKYTRTKRRERRADTLEAHRRRIVRSAENIIDQALDQAHANRDDDDGPRPLQGSAYS
ncbi:hypothetical protein I5G81_gp47 [Mycobacterium phage Shandong1]|uniref:Uncharacterized protein n=1 Tax=Mycobacterium phage Shandong1 TaxID=1983447 RepID=A0A1X9SHD7_9CAUD|nr:hypothetical protein I5G81_gp47 [Mycobacterium phage Shandong1]ARQ95486.1 hypothetical protein [Mycobacterium phage Shandong1]